MGLDRRRAAALSEKVSPLPSHGDCQDQSYSLSFAMTRQLRWQRQSQAEVEPHELLFGYYLCREK